MKKRLLIVLMLVAHLFAYSKSNEDVFTSNNFVKTSEFEYIWQKVFEVEMTKEEILNAIKFDHFFSSISSETQDCILGETAIIQPQFSQCGVNPNFANMYIASGNIKGNLRIDVKDGAYRVTISNIVTLNTGATNSTFTLASWILKKNGKFRTSHTKTMKVINFTFTNLYTVKDLTDNDW